MMHHRKSLVTLSICIMIVILQLFSFCHHQSPVNSDTYQARVRLGQYLFFDRRLSVNDTRSCGTCHNPLFAFTDGYKRSLGVYADLHQRNTEPLFNLSYFKYLTAADSSLHAAFNQMNNPLFNEHPAEMGVKGNEESILLKISKDSFYKRLFTEAFPSESKPVNWTAIKSAISEFVYTIKSENSLYDKYNRGDSAALSAEQKSGRQLFFSNRLHCSACHGGFNFSSPTIVNPAGDTLYYFNTGLYNTDGRGSYPEYDQGLYQFTKQPADMGAFRVPTLRNLAFTAPYFHDGSVATLDSVIDIYARGGRKISTGINQGDGKLNPNRHPLINGFDLTAAEKNDLLLFLYSLTDSTVLSNPKYSNPFAEDETKKK